MLSRHTRLSHPRPVAAATAPGLLTSGRDDTRFFGRNVRRGFAADDDEVDQQVELPVRFPRFLTAVHNQVERFFAELTNKQLRRAAHRSTLELERAIRGYIDVRNRNPKPFVWTKTADDILASIERFCRRISGTGH